MTNSYYTATGTPSFQTRALSSQQRNEDSLVQAGFDKLPAPNVLGGSGQNYAVDTGMPSNIVVPLNAQVTSPFDGMELVVKVISAATGPSTVLAGALSIAPVVRYDNSPIRANDWLPGQIISLRYSAANSNYQFTPASNATAVASVPLLDSSPSFANATDQSKLVKLNLSALSTGTTRNLTVLDRDVVIGNFKDKVTQTGNVQITKANNSNIIDITGGASFTQTFDAAASLGAGFWCIYRNNGNGVGDIVLDPNGAELIDGLSSYVMYPGEVRLITGDGTTLTSIVLHGFKKIFTSNGNFVKPPGYLEFGGMLWCGGASGQRTNSLITASSAGAGGGCSDFKIAASAFGASEVISVGAGGAAVTGVANGNVGNNSSIGSIFTVFAGVQFNAGGSIRAGLTGVTQSSGGNITTPTGYEGGKTDTVPSPTVWGGASPSSDGSNSTLPSSTFGGAAGGSISSAGVVRAPGTSVLGGNGGAASVAGNGTAGVAPGGGGGATQTGTQSGAGARGQVEIWGIV